jgi:hypothetical protein
MIATLMPVTSVSTAVRPVFVDRDPFKSGAVLRLNVPIEDLRGHGDAVVDRLRQALAEGAPFVKDRKRPRFYEVRVGAERFYIHVLRGVTKVLLIACWTEMPA